MTDSAAPASAPETENGQPCARRSDRIRYAFRLRLSGIDSTKCQFESDGHTEVVTRDGGLIVTPVSLAVGSEINVRYGERTSAARVVGHVGIRNDYYLYGIQFTEAGNEDFWGINFPEGTSAADVARTVLQCTRCGRQELLRMKEVDLLVFEHTLSVPYHCEQCKTETLWNRPVILGDPTIATGSDAYQLHSTESFVRPRNINDRKHPRVAMKNVRACLQRPNFADDVVDVLDLSRGGIRFLSLIDYPPGTSLMVSVPYMAGGANVFLRAKVIRVKCRPTVDIPGEFGLQYEPR